MSQHETPADPARAALELARQRQDLELSELKAQRNVALDENCSLRAEIALLRSAVREARASNEASQSALQQARSNLTATINELAGVKEELRLERQKPAGRSRTRTRQPQTP